MRASQEWLPPIEHAVPAQCAFDIFGGPLGQAGGARRRERRFRGESDGMRLKRQTRLMRHALSNGAEATSTVSVGQAIASSYGFTVAIDPAKLLTIVRLG